jgi:hypothetical protein
LAISACGIVIAAGFVIGSVLGVIQSTTESRVEAQQANVIGRILEKNPIMERSESRFSGRSIFYVPKEPRRPAPPDTPRVEPEEAPKPEPTPKPEPVQSVPSKYAGPGIRGILGNEVFFDSGKRIKVGESADGVDVLKINGPFSIRLGWKTGEYEVSLFAEEIPEFFGTAPYQGAAASTLLSLETSDNGAQSYSDAAAAQARALAEARERQARENAQKKEQNRSGSDQADVPSPLEQSQIDEMSRIDAIRAMSTIGRALRQDLDEQTKERLEAERNLLREHIRNNAGAE